MLPEAAMLEAVSINCCRFRKARGLTYDALAKRSSISKGMLVEIEKGRANPSRTHRWRSLTVSICGETNRAAAGGVLRLTADASHRYSKMRSCPAARCQQQPQTGQRECEARHPAERNFLGEKNHTCNRQQPYGECVGYPYRRAYGPPRPIGQ
jgi:transcriptional regulator with XRE-family HTH domain